MLISVNRFVSDSESTISHVSVDGKVICFGLEDQYQTIKVPKETRIWAGNYEVRLRKSGAMHARYSERFGAFHKGMLHIVDVPEFKWILIHIGNTDSDTEGCLLVGDQASTKPGAMNVRGSAVAYTRLYKYVVDAAAEENLKIEFLDRDR